MKLELFKKLIKETVREAVREEVGLLLLEQKRQSLTENFSFTTKDVVPVYTSNNSKKMSEMFGNNKQNVELPEEITEGNPFAAFIADAAANMTPQERSALKKYD